MLMHSEDAVHVKLPSDLEEAKELGRVVNIYKDQYYEHVIVFYCATYLLYATSSVFLFIFLFFRIQNHTSPACIWVTKLASCSLHTSLQCLNKTCMCIVL